MKKHENQNRKRWLIQGGMGNALIGLGLCLITDASCLKSNEPESTIWILYGTIALILTLTGVNLTVDALRYRPE